MVVNRKKSKFCWYISFLIFTLLIPTGNLYSGDINPSGYKKFKGGRFFLLTDSIFSSKEEAKVRLEASGSSSLLAGYSGVDLFVYEIPDPIKFLKKQRNLHRPNVKGNYTGEGLQNVFNYLWDVGFKKSRLAWQRILSVQSRKHITEKIPELKQFPPHTYHTEFKNHPQYKALKEFKLIDKFRYPFLEAQPIGPPQGVILPGSSSNFIKIKEGNVYIPIGERKPGLYFVEAIIGEYRASTIAFVSDTIAISKMSKDRNLIWTVNKSTGQPSPKTKIHLTDGIGTISSGMSDKDGLVVFDKNFPEHTYIIGEGADGSVFVSENYFYASEINDIKLYTFTDRPLYRPGDLVHLKVFGLDMKDHTKAALLEPGSMRLVLLDQNSTPILTKTLEFTEPTLGTEVDFNLPSFSTSGGYSIQINYQGRSYASAFRVSTFTKPHYEIDISVDQDSARLNQKIPGTVKLTFPNGSPVLDAEIEISARIQKLTMVDGELRYQGLFPLQIFDDKVAVSDKGHIEFELPEVKEPSRFVIYAKSIDQSGYAVTAKKEILVEEGLSQMKIISDGRISIPEKTVVFRLIKNFGDSEDFLKWEAVRLEDQKMVSGRINPTDEKFEINFGTPGSYIINVKNDKDHVLASINHWVQGEGLHSIPGSVSLVSDQDNFKVGATANILMTFPEEINEALITLERDKVEKSGLISQSYDWVKFDKKSPRQWLASLPITDAYKPNIIFSVAYVLDNQFYFQNKGFQIKPEEILINIRPNKDTYFPGEEVKVDVETKLNGRSTPSILTVSVVDEMVYLVQPEMAPNIFDFFYHRDRNQVRTSSSLSFYTYDAAVPPTSFGPNYTSYNERTLKEAIQERPRRENTDTAFWATNIKTDKNGKGKFSFVMPQSLSRWRMTIRAIDKNGNVGQRKSFIASSKDYYLKWVGPKVFRKGDIADVNLVAFNLKNEGINSVIETSGLGSETKINKYLTPGPNYLSFRVKAKSDGTIATMLNIDGQRRDALETKISVLPKSWLTTKSNSFKVDQVKSSITIPEGAFNTRLGLSRGFSGHFLEVADKLIGYPYGCVEQTASKIIPLSLIYGQIQKVGLSQNVFSRLNTLLENSRLRIVQMAGPRATFNWWGDLAKGSPFLTSYAYFADWSASKALNLRTTENQWDGLLDIYGEKFEEESLFLNALSLYLANEIGLPVQTLLLGLVEIGQSTQLVELPKLSGFLKTSYAFPESPNTLSDSLAIFLIKVTAQELNIPLSFQFLQNAKAAQKNLLNTDSPLAKALLILENSQKGLTLEHEKISKVMVDLASQMPTIDRSLGLIFLQRAILNQAKEVSSIY